MRNEAPHHRRLQAIHGMRVINGKPHFFSFVERVNNNNSSIPEERMTEDQNDERGITRMKVMGCISCGE